MDAEDPYAPPKADVAMPVEPDTAPLASRWARLGGALLDGVFIALISGAMHLVIYHEWRLSSGTETKPELIDTILFMVPEAVWLVCNARMLHTRGQTVGKMVAGTRIVRRDGQPTTFWFLLGMRYVPLWGVQFATSLIEVFVPSLATAAQWIGGIVAIANLLLIFRKSRACLHDDIAGTKVIAVRSGYRAGQDWNAWRDEK